MKTNMNIYNINCNYNNNIIIEEDDYILFKTG